jgi:serine/threonine protein kinase
VKEIFAAALNLPPEARASYLSATCGGDDQLRAQVQGLLDSHERAGSFLETSQEPANDPESPRLRLAGQRIGAYEVVARLGAGGMGEVYRARDLRLGRDVAIKILPEVFTRDPERLARFEREARVLAALTHPNIGAIYGVEDPAPGSGPLTTPALLLELVEGDTLAERIARSARDSGFGRQRGLSMVEAVKIAAQMADALEAAHDKGIIHRDLKPANVKITPAGVVKVLDFGLAKAGLDDDTTSPDISQSPTMTVDGTRAGMILGTAAYMSPEQARGHVVDKRTDIWAFGCVLYEVLAGRAAFPGATVSDTIAAILEREPEWSALPSGTPESVRHLLRRCLEKDARQRLRDIGEARSNY